MARLIRLRADQDLLSSIELSERVDTGGFIELPPRPYLVSEGDEVRLEFGFGALSDEIMVQGRALDVATVDGEGQSVRVELVTKHADRLRYVHGVLSGTRDPVVRRHRRVPYRAAVHLTVGPEFMRAMTDDISCGGAFIVSSSAPAVDTEVKLTLSLEQGRRVQTAARVTWSGVARGQRGFGIEFLHLEPNDVQALREIVREREE